MAKSRKPSWLLLFALLGLLVGLSDFARFVGRVGKLSPPEISQSDGIVALTGGSGHRIKAAIDLLQETSGARLLVSGVHESVDVDELLQAAGGTEALYACCIDIGHAASSTIGNAQETANWVRKHQFETIVVVTSNYHMPRSLIWFEHYLPETKLVTYPVQSRIQPKKWWGSWRSFRGLLVEWIKFRISTVLLVFR